ncbi:MAG: DUF2905 domain-containing protein [Candidatus Manganitrophaceae bacterium]
MTELGRILIVLGIVVAAVGGIMMFAEKIPGIGRLPGDIFVQRRNISFYFPITTSILLSVLLSVLFWLLSRK